MLSFIFRNCLCIRRRVISPLIYFRTISQHTSLTTIPVVQPDISKYSLLVPLTYSTSFFLNHKEAQPHQPYLFNNLYPFISINSLYNGSTCPAVFPVGQPIVSNISKLQIMYYQMKRELSTDKCTILLEVITFMLICIVRGSFYNNGYRCWFQSMSCSIIHTICFHLQSA